MYSNYRFLVGLRQRHATQGLSSFLTQKLQNIFLLFSKNVGALPMTLNCHWFIESSHVPYEKVVVKTIDIKGLPNKQIRNIITRSTKGILVIISYLKAKG